MISNKQRIRDRKLKSSKNKKINHNITKNINSTNNQNGINKRITKFDRKNALRKNAYGRISEYKNTSNYKKSSNNKEIIENNNLYKLDSDGRIIENRKRNQQNIHQRINSLSEWSNLFSNNQNNISMISNDSSNSSKISVMNDYTTNSSYECCIDWNLQIYNDLFTYGINSAVNTINDNGYLLGQYEYPGISLDSFVLTTPENTSSIFYMETDSSGEILNAIKLWTYNGLREDYQFGQLQFTSDSTNIILLTTFIGEITFNDDSTISDNNGNTMIGLFELDGTPIWVRQITARSIDDIYFTLDSENNIYICGTFAGTLQISDPSSPLITSNLETNMFIGRINFDGTTQWLLTALGTGYNTGEGIDYSSNDNTIVACGNYTETFILDNFTLADTVALTNSWIAKLDLDGNPINLVAPLRPVTNDPILIDFFDTGQIVTSSTGDVYVTGDMLGYFIFNQSIEITAEVFSVFIAKLNSDLEWQWINIMQVGIPLDNFYQPKLTIVESQSTVVVTNFGFGTATFFTPDETPSDDTITYTCCGSGLLDLWISQVNISDGSWRCSNKISGSIENFSINIVSATDNVYVAGSRIISNERTDGILVNIGI